GGQWRGHSCDILSSKMRPQMRGEEERLRTFENWRRDTPVTAGNLARAGFYFLGTEDKVQCFCCGGILRYWVHGDSPIVEHKRHFPACSFVLGRAVGNIPLFVVSRSPSDSVDGQLLSQLQRMTVDDQGTAGQAVYPEMELEESRLTTFHNWPTGAAVQPNVLARAGFFYTGHGDNVKCFHCDGGLRNWEPGDDPWQEHAMWFPRCDFLIQTRGRDYVSNIQRTGRGTDGSLSGAFQFTVGDSTPEELLRQLQEERTCKVCMDKLVSIVFIPCGHLVVCSDCAASLRHCPICRATIRGSVRAFMS
uniref:RING-type E3 ubiquitin transferase n=1 Tax=Oncorhynchus kisutch TaxID=8019 RepID=A0A8C7LME7_ONCKI